MLGRRKTNPKDEKAIKSNTTQCQVYRKHAKRWEIDRHQNWSHKRMWKPIKSERWVYGRMKIKSITTPSIWKAHKAIEINQSKTQILKESKTIQNDGSRLDHDPKYTKNLSTNIWSKLKIYNQNHQNIFGFPSLSLSCHGYS